MLGETKPADAAVLLKRSFLVRRGRRGKGKNISGSAKVSFGKWVNEAVTAADDAAIAADEAAIAADEARECKPPAVTSPFRARSQKGEGSTPADDAATAGDERGAATAADDGREAATAANDGKGGSYCSK